MIVAGAFACAAAVWLAAAAALAPELPRPRWTHPELDRLRDAEWRWSGWRWEALRSVVASAAGAAAWLQGWDPGVPLALGLVAPSFVLHLRSGWRREQRRRAALAHFRAIGAALASGASLVEAIRRVVASEPDAIAVRPFARALHAFSVGASLSDGLRDAVAGAHSRTRPALLTLALGVEERLPIARLATLVGSVVERLSFDEQVEAEVRARTSGARLQIWLMAAIVPLLGVYLVATVPIVADVLTSELGRRLLIPAAASLELAGVVLARRAVRDVTK